MSKRGRRETSSLQKKAQGYNKHPCGFKDYVLDYKGTFFLFNLKERERKETD